MIIELKKLMLPGTTNFNIEGRTNELNFNVAPPDI